MKARCCLWLHKYGPKKDGVGTYPVKLRVTFKREVKYYYLGLKLTDSQFSGLLYHRQLKSQYQELSHYLSKAETIIADLREEFEWITFENLFFSRNKERNNNPDIFTSIEKYINQLRKEGRIKSMQSYTTTLNHLKIYHGKKNQTFSSITPDWLKLFNQYLSEQGKKTSTIGIYMRNIRAIFNQEIANNRIKSDNYPFGRNMSRPPSSSRVIKSLSIGDVTNGCIS